MEKDYYKTLGVNKNASEDELKKAYRKLAHEHHPDKGGNEAKFKEVNEAFQVLGDKEKRAKYDQFGAGFEQMGGGFGGGGGQGFGGFEDLGSMFGDLGGMFGGFGGGGQRQQRGQDVAVDVELSLHDVAFGIEKELSLRKYEVCDKCNGNGAERGSSLKKCASCDGKGQTVRIQRTILGNIQAVQMCGQCGGAGQIPEKKCSECRGEGAYDRTVKITVKIPGGIDDGEQMRVRGKGQAGPRGASPGDLYVRVHVKRDAELTRDEFDIHSTVRIGFALAALGGSKKIRTLDGELDLKIPEGTQGGQIIRLKARGITNLHGTGRGDHFVEVQIEIPTRLSRNQRKLLEEFEN